MLKQNFRTRKPHFESLEERTLLAVTAGLIQQDLLPDNTAQTEWLVNSIDDPASWDTSDGILSLREAIDRASDGDLITFDSSLADQIITLNGTQLDIARVITIDATGIGGITINADQESRVFNISGGTKENPVELINITITGAKTSSSGGGIYARNSSTLTLTNCTLTGNTAKYTGGGIFADNSSTLTLSNCTITGNTADSSGGGIYIEDSSTLTFINCTINGNSADSGGGIRTDGTLILTNCTISGNSADGIGGGIYAYSSSTLTFTNCTIAGNSADCGGGIYARSTLTLYNSIITQNTAKKSGTDVFNEFETLNAYNTLSSYTFWSGRDNLTYDPSKPLFTSPETGDFTLAVISQAIDRGNNEYVTTETDIIGNPRICNGIVDLGAYEAMYEVRSTIVTTLFDIVDVKDNLISLREAILYAEEGGVITFDSSLTDQTITLNGTQLDIAKGITVDASGIGGITINADQKSRVFNISGGTEENPVELINITITGGKTIDNGGGIYARDSSTLTLTNSTIAGNTASDGGGIYARDSSTLTLTNCTIAGNTAPNSGGIYAGESSTLTLTNCTIAGNTASNGGGIYARDSSTLTLTNCTIARNTASNSGGGIYTKISSSFTLYNSIIAQNNASTSGNDVYGSGTLNTYNTLSSYTDWTSGRDNLTYDSSKPLFTSPETGDFTLAENSQAIDKGNNEYVTTETDIIGNPRISSGIVDLGAYEAMCEVRSTIVTTHLDIVDVTDDLISLREAIFYAEEGGVITFDPSLAGQTITLNGTQLEIAKRITIDASGIGGITINANQKSRVFNITGGEKNPVELINLTITGGKTSDDGGGIYTDGTLTLTNCAVAGNTASDGGGIYTDGTLTLTNCTISGNSAFCGGGIYIDGTLTLTNCTIAGNNASEGGGIYAYSSTLTLTDCVITENNSAFFNGGGINAYSSTLTLTNCTISENTTDFFGGGIYAPWSSTFTLTNCAITGNSASDGGGIYADWFSTFTLTNCTITENSADFNGGGINAYSSTLTLYNSIIAQNTANDSGNDIYDNDYTSAFNAYNTLSSFTDWTTSESPYLYDPAKPLFRSPETGGYTLAANSQAIDIGNNAYVTTETDLLGNPRIVNNIVDLGAYEYQTAQPEPLDAPTILTGENGYYVSYGANRHQIEWLPVESAAGYELIYTTDSKTWQTITASPDAAGAIVTGLTYGTAVTYKLRAIAANPAYSSDWTAPVTFDVCPMDINNDGDIANADRAFLAAAWLSEKGETNFNPAADIDGNGEISNSDRSFLAANWLKESTDDGLTYPRPVAAELAAPLADAVFTTPGIF